jgi:hypothetical protein
MVHFAGFSNSATNSYALADEFMYNVSSYKAECFCHFPTACYQLISIWVYINPEEH